MTDMDRSIVRDDDPPAAFEVEGWLAGYARSGVDDCPYECSRAVFWRVGYFNGSRMRSRIAVEHVGRRAL